MMSRRPVFHAQSRNTVPALRTLANRRSSNDCVIRRPCGFTLVELVTNMTVMTLLMAGMASTITIARLAIPSSRSITATTIDASDALEVIANDLRYATTIPFQTATSVTLTVPDRDGQSPAFETISYSWSGVSGDPLIRTFNGNSSNLLSNVNQFSLVGFTRPVPLPVTYSESALVPLASYTSNTSLADWTLATKTWIGEYIQPSPPSAVSYKIKQVKFNAKQTSPATGTTLVQIRSATGFLPTTTVLDTQTLNESALPEAYGQQTINFANCPSTPIGTGLCVVLKFGTNSSSCLVEHQNAGASTGTNRMISTTNSESGWVSSAVKSMLFEVWGTYMTQDAQAYQYFLKNMKISLQSGTDSRSRLETSVRVFNEPQVPIP
jgi:Tfp pilus assembly protein FimT